MRKKFRIRKKNFGEIDFEDHEIEERERIYEEEAKEQEKLKIYDEDEG